MAIKAYKPTTPGRRGMTVMEEAMSAFSAFHDMEAEVESINRELAVFDPAQLIVTVCYERKNDKARCSDHCDHHKIFSKLC